MLWRRKVRRPKNAVSTATTAKHPTQVVRRSRHELPLRRLNHAPQPRPTHAAGFTHMSEAPLAQPGDTLILRYTLGEETFNTALGLLQFNNLFGSGLNR